MKTRRGGITWRTGLVGGLLVLVTACSRKADDHDHDHDHEATSEVSTEHAHEHHAPHGGTAVVLGEEAFHLELVLEPAAGTLRAFVLDGEMERFIRSPSPQIEVVARLDGKPRPLVLRAMADASTGETVGDTSLFEGSAEWLKTTPEFEGVLASIMIRGVEFADVAFDFPEGNEHDKHDEQ